jgi:hypothetical protein
MKKIFRNVIEDYGVPSYCTASKYAFGTLDDFKKLSEFLKFKHEYVDFTNAIDKYLAGERKLKYNIAYSEEKLMEGVKVLYERDIDIEDFNYKHINVWSCVYNFHCKRFKAKRLLVQIRSTIYVLIRPVVETMEIVHSNADNLPIGAGTWGFPGIISFDENTNILTTNLYLIEKKFHATKESKEALDFFEKNEFYLKSYFDEIVGDG